MRRMMLTIWLVVLAIVAVGMLAVGLFPPAPHTQPVQHILPTDKFNAN